MLEWQWKERVVPYWKETAKRLPSSRRARRDRDAPELRRLQPRDDAAAARRRARDDRLQLRSEPHVLAGGRRVDGHPRARRSHLPRPRQGLPNRPREHGAATACSTPRATPTSSNAPGSSARSATATTPSSGRTSSATCAWSATTTCISIEHEDSLMSGAEGLRKAIEMLRGHGHQRAGGKGVLGVTDVSRREALRKLESAVPRRRRRRLGRKCCSAAAEQHAAHYHQAAAASAVFKPKVFNAAQNKTVTTLAELIIPQTDTAAPRKRRSTSSSTRRWRMPRNRIARSFSTDSPGSTRAAGPTTARHSPMPRQRSNSRC